MQAVSRGKRTYYYSSYREGDQVKKRYIGTGELAEIQFLAWQLDKLKKSGKRKLEKEESAQLWTQRSRMDIVRCSAHEAIEVAYLGAGYSKTRCYHWRKTPSRRLMEENNQMPEERKTNLPTNGVRTDKATRLQNLREVIEAIKSGKDHLRPQLRRLLLEEDPKSWLGVADVTRMVADQWAARISPDVVIRESILLAALKERQTLAPAGSSSVELVLADRLVLAKLQQQYFELQLAAVAGDVDVIGTKIGDAMEKRVRTATHELDRAVSHFKKAKELKAEVKPPRPDTAVAALKIYDPNSQKRKSA